MEDRIDILERRARRLRKSAEFRKAANAYGELTSLAPNDARWWVLLGVTLHEGRRDDESAKAFRQAIYLFRRANQPARERSVRLMIARIPALQAAA